MATPAFSQSLTDITVPTMATAPSGTRMPVQQSTSASIISGLTKAFEAYSPILARDIAETRVKTLSEPFLKLEEAQSQKAIDQTQYISQRKQLEIDLLRSNPADASTVFNLIGGSYLQAENKKEFDENARLRSVGLAQDPTLGDSEAINLGRKTETAARDLKNFQTAIEMANNLDKTAVTQLTPQAQQHADKYLDMVFGSSFKKSLSEVSKFAVQGGLEDPRFAKAYTDITANLENNLNFARQNFNTMIGGFPPELKKVAEAQFALREKEILSITSLKDNQAIKNVTQIATTLAEKTNIEFSTTFSFLYKLNKIGGESGLSILTNDYISKNMPQITKQLQQFASGNNFDSTNPTDLLKNALSLTKNAETMKNAPVNERPGLQKLSLDRANSIISGERIPFTSEEYLNITANVGDGAQFLQTNNAINQTLAFLSSDAHAKQLEKESKTSTSVLANQAVATKVNTSLLKIAVNGARQIKSYSTNVDVGIEYNPSTKSLSILDKAKDPNAALMAGVESLAAPSDQKDFIDAQNGIAQIDMAKKAFVNHAKFDAKLMNYTPEELENIFLNQVNKVSGTNFYQVTPPESKKGSVSTSATIQDVTREVLLEQQQRRIKLEEEPVGQINIGQLPSQTGPIIKYLKEKQDRVFGK